MGGGGGGFTITYIWLYLCSQDRSVCSWTEINESQIAQLGIFRNSDTINLTFSVTKYHETWNLLMQGWVSSIFLVLVS